MDDYPGNSDRKPIETPVLKPQKVSEPDKKRIERVTTTDPMRRKKPLGARLKETFIGGDAKTAAAYVIFDVLIPAARDTVIDAFTQGIERFFYPDSRFSSRRTAYRAGSTGYQAYNRYSGTSSYRPQQDPRMERQSVPLRRQQITHDFDEIILATSHEAREVLERLGDLIERYEAATVNDLYELVGITAQYTDEKWGWTDLQSASVIKTRHGYLLGLPQPQSIV